MSRVQGQCDPRFEEVRDLLQSLLDSGDELGAAITVNLHGKDIIDIWGGYEDPDQRQGWQQDTIVNVWSSTKTVLNLAALMAIDRGLVDATTKVSTFWPEFGANGKGNIEVRMLMSHTAGLSAWADKLNSVSDLYDVEKATALLGAQAPFWEPGTASGYHATTQGYLVGEVVKRTTGKRLAQFVADEISTPLGADFQIGCISSDWGRVATLIPPTDPFPPIDPQSVALKTLTNPPTPATTANTPEWRSAELGAVNGHGNARSLAKIMSAITLGGCVDGVRLLKPETIDLIFQEQASGTDLVLGLPIKFGIGYGLRADETDVDWIPSGERICFWSGWGGSMVIMDIGRGLTFTYVMNKMGGGTLGNDRTKQYVKAVYRALGVDA